MSVMDQERSPRQRADWIIGGVVMAVLLVALFMFTSQRQTALRTSASGLDGLGLWLQAGDIPVRNFTGGWTLDPAEFGLSILPLYDTRLQQDRVAPTTQKGLLTQQDEFDIRLSAFEEKRRMVSTLVVLPKWRTGLRLTRIGHPVLRSSPKDIEQTLRDVSGAPSSKILFSGRVFTDFDYSPQQGARMTATIYAAQLATAPNCRPVIGQTSGFLLGDCTLEDGTEFYLLSDPDLVNNHGLRLGDNALIVRDFIQNTAQERDVLIDYAPASWFKRSDQPTDRPERQWSDILQFLQYPFSLIWIGGLGFLGLSIWRAQRRFGPVRDQAGSPSKAKIQAIEARAHLMQLTGANAALVKDYAAARFEAVSANVIGPAYGRSEAATLKQLGRSQPENARRLSELLEHIRNLQGHSSAQNLIDLVDEYENLLSEIENDTR